MRLIYALVKDERVMCGRTPLLTRVRPLAALTCRSSWLGRSGVLDSLV